MAIREARILAAKICKLARSAEGFERLTASELPRHLEALPAPLLHAVLGRFHLGTNERTFQLFDELVQADAKQSAIEVLKGCDPRTACTLMGRERALTRSLLDALIQSGEDPWSYVRAFFDLGVKPGSLPAFGDNPEAVLRALVDEMGDLFSLGLSPKNRRTLRSRYGWLRDSAFGEQAIAALDRIGPAPGG